MPRRGSALSLWNALTLRACAWQSVLGIFSLEEGPTGKRSDGKLLTRILRGEDVPLTQGQNKAASSLEDPLVDEAEDQAEEAPQPVRAAALLAACLVVEPRKK